MGRGTPTKPNLAMKSPKIANEWNIEKNKPLLPEDFLPFSSKRVWWICQVCGHEWQTRISDRQRSGCPCCAGQAVNSQNQKNSLENMVPEILTEWDYEMNELSPNQILPRSSKQIHWKCTNCTGLWMARLSSRLDKDLNIKRGCPYCTNQKVHPDGRNSLAALHPIIASEWDTNRNKPLLSSDIVATSNKKYWWKCEKCYHEWIARPASRVRLSTGCPACLNKAVHIDGRNSLETLRPDLATWWHPTLNRGLLPGQVTIGSNKSVWWKCPECDAEFKSSICGRIRKNGQLAGCKYCSNMRVHPDGRNSLETLCPDLASEWDPTNNLKPSEVTPGADLVVKWICVNGHKWSARVKSRRIAGCPSCADYGLNLESETSLYILKIDLENGLHCFKIGITNRDVKERILQIMKSLKSIFSEPNVTLLKEFRFVSGHIAKFLESMVKSNFIQFKTTKIFDGYTECLEQNPTEFVDSQIEEKYTEILVSKA